MRQPHQLRLHKRLCCPCLSPCPCWNWVPVMLLCFVQCCATAVVVACNVALTQAGAAAHVSDMCSSVTTSGSVTRRAEMVYVRAGNAAVLEYVLRGILCLLLSSGHFLHRCVRRASTANTPDVRVSDPLMQRRLASITTAASSLVQSQQTADFAQHSHFRHPSIVQHMRIRT
jgi:hypothetical protein